MAGGRGAWEDLAEEHFGEIVEPSHLQRGLDLHESLPRLDDGEAVSRWLDQRRVESTALSDHARQRLFDEWFERRYA